MKKKIIICVFLLLIVVTSFVFIKSAIDSYNYDMDPANGVDIMEGMGAAMLLVLGGFIVFYELDLFYTVFYFAIIKPKTLIKSIFVALSNITLLLIFFTEYIADAFSISEETNVTIALFFIYLILKLISIFVLFTEED